MAKLKIAIAASFTAEPVEESLRFFMRQLEIDADIAFAPYNQLFQMLLDSSSILGANRAGVNVILLRFEDWLEATDEASGAAHATDDARLTQHIQDLALALRTAVQRSATPYLICLSPASRVALADARRAALFERLEGMLFAELADCATVYPLTSSDLMATYPVVEYDDPLANRLGRIPYSAAWFAALGTLLARRIYRLYTPGRKVLVLDCDQTLWSGVCAEVGPSGVEVDLSRRAMQEFIVKQHDAGMLICLCSRNEEQDVLAVFAQRPDMPLRREHLLSWRINWQPKSENLKSLAQELQLGLGSFVFVDDDPVVCAEVQANCPEVLVLRLPQESERLRRFLPHVWELDHLRITEEDRQRTGLYRQNLARETWRRESLSYADFLASLELRVEITEVEAKQLARVAQLVERTNQFNVTNRRQSAGEIEHLCRSGALECRAVSASDRFGDYGMVGVMMFSKEDGALLTDTFLLSCRALGRGVEHRMLAYLAEVALSSGLAELAIRFVKSARNRPALEFLESLESHVKEPAADGSILFRFLASQLRNCANVLPPAPPSLPAEAESGTAKRPARTGAAEVLNRIATELCTVEELLAAIAAQEHRARPTSSGDYVTARDSVEAQLVAIWARLLRLDRIGINDDYFALGGTSLLAVSLFSQIEQRFGKNLPLSTLLQAPTVARLAAILRGDELAPAWASLVAIEQRGSRPPFFCTHGAYAHVLYLRLLSRHLGPEQPFYGLQSFGLDGEQAPFTRIEQMAAHYLKAVRAVQSEGPYYLGGYSFGGVVAYEMAQQLRASGQRVALLAMMDTYFPRRPKSLGPVNKFRAQIYPWVNRAERHYDDLMRLGVPSYLLAQLRALRELWQTRNTPYPRHWSAFPPTLRRVMEANLKAERLYIPRPYPGRITLFWASHVGPDVHDTRLGWGEVAQDGLEVHMIPGGHISFREEPYVAILAEKLKSCLSRAAHASPSMRTDLSTDARSRG